MLGATELAGLLDTPSLFVFVFVLEFVEAVLFSCEGIGVGTAVVFVDEDGLSSAGGASDGMARGRFRGLMVFVVCVVTMLDLEMSL